jgi:hypothetical protein
MICSKDRKTVDLKKIWIRKFWGEMLKSKEIAPLQKFESPFFYILIFLLHIVGRKQNKKGFSLRTYCDLKIIIFSLCREAV